jgi:hypothetical protein
MNTLRERHPTEGIRGISWQYNKLAVQFSRVAELFLDRSMREFAVKESMQEVAAFLEVKASEKEIRKALEQIGITLTKLKRINSKFKFDKPVLNTLYQQELLLCKSSIETMKNSLNTIWDEGKPVKNDIPFAGSTTYKFVMKTMLKYMNEVNTHSKLINVKIILFNRSNKKSPQLQPLPVLTTPDWVKKL